MSAQSPVGNAGYRDEREAALAQVESLRQQVAALEPECQRLRAENAQLRAELSRLGGFVPTPTRTNSVLVAIIAGIVALMFVGGAASFLLMRTTSTAPSYAPVPVSVAPPSATILPSAPVPSMAPPVSVVPTHGGPQFAPSGT